MKRFFWLGLLMTACAMPDPGTTLATETKGLTIHYIEHGDRTRSYALFTPSTTKAHSKTPVMFSFHGGMGTYKAQVKMSQWNPVAEKKEFLVVYPNGTGPLNEALLTFNAGMCCGYAWKNKIDDVGFVTAILNDLKKRKISFDEKRVYASGMSNGGMMSYTVGCELSEKIAGIGPVAGASILDCPQLKRPLPIFHVHGLKDTNYPFQGKPKNRPRISEEFKPIDDVVKAWVRNNNAESTPLITKSKHFTKYTYAQKKGQRSAPIVLLVIPEGGHTWPGGELPGIDVGPLVREVPASEMMWEFLSQYHL